MEWSDYAGGGIGAIFGSLVTILGFRSRLDKAELKQSEVEKDCAELKTETLTMFYEIREDIKKLISKTADRRQGE